MNTIPRWTPTGFQLGNSIITEPTTSQVHITPVAGGTNVFTVNNFDATSTAIKINANGGTALNIDPASTGINVQATTTGISISGATTSLTIDNGNLILGSSVNTIASGGTIPDGQSVVDVDDDGFAFSVATVTLPVSPTNGQVCFVTTEDPDGVQITVGLASVTISNAEVGKFMYINGTWRLEH